MQAANKCYYAHSKLFTSNRLKKKTKITLYKILIRPIATYGADCWRLNNSDERMLLVFERRILRKIYGPVRETDGTYRVRFNHELERLIEGKNIVKFIKSRRLEWLGHVLRINNRRGPKVLLDAAFQDNRERGRPRRRWLDDVQKDLKVMRVTNCQPWTVLGGGASQRRSRPTQSCSAMMMMMMIQTMANSLNGCV